MQNKLYFLPLYLINDSWKSEKIPGRVVKIANLLQIDFEYFLYCCGKYLQNSVKNWCKIFFNNYNYPLLNFYLVISYYQFVRDIFQAPPAVKHVDDAKTLLQAQVVAYNIVLDRVLSTWRKCTLVWRNACLNNCTFLSLMVNN